MSNNTNHSVHVVSAFVAEDIVRGLDDITTSYRGSGLERYIDNRDNLGIVHDDQLTLKLFNFGVLKIYHDGSCIYASLKMDVRVLRHKVMIRISRDKSIRWRWTNMDENRTPWQEVKRRAIKAHEEGRKIFYCVCNAGDEYTQCGWYDFDEEPELVQMRGDIITAFWM